MKSDDEKWRHIEILSELRANYDCFDENEEPYYKALSVGIKAIKALKQEPILAKVRAEIEQEYCKIESDYDKGRNMGLRIAMQIIDKYKAESEG